MTDITFANKVQGAGDATGQLSVDDVNAIKLAVNSKAPKENTSFIAGSLADLRILTTAEPEDGSQLISDLPIDKAKQTYTAAKIDTLIGTPITPSLSIITTVDDPTESSSSGLYVAPSNGKFFIKTDTGLFTIAGTYVADPASPVFTPSQTWDFEAGLPPGATVAQTAKITTGITTLDPISGTNSLKFETVVSTKDAAYCNIPFTSVSDLYFELKFRLSANFRSNFAAGRVKILVLGSASIFLVYQGGNMVLEANTAKIISRGDTHTLGVKLITSTTANDGFEIFLDGESAYSNGFSSAYTTAPSSFQVGMVPYHDFYADISLTVDDIAIGPYVA